MSTLIDKEDQMWSVLGRNLLRAVETGTVDKVKQFLKNGADPDFITFEGVTPLSLSVALGYNTITCLLLEAGCDVNQVVSDGREKGCTVLHVAARHGRYSAMSALLKHNPKLNFRDTAGRTPCMIAGFLGQERILKLLVNSGADVNMTDGVQRSALHWTALQGHVNCVQFLLESSETEMVNSTDWNGETPLICACREGRDTVVRMLLKAGANVNISNKPHKTTDMLTEYTPLHVAAHNGHQSIVEQLLHSGANIDKQDGTGRLPLHWAAQKKRTFIAELLLQGNSLVNIANIKGETPLQESILPNNDKIVWMLLQNGAIPDLITKASDPPLIKAVKTEIPNLVRMILQSNCDVNSVGSDGRTAFTTALSRGAWDIVKMLVFSDCDLSLVKSYIKADKQPNRLVGKKDMIQWLNGIADNPRSLKVQCRMLIRKFLGYKIKLNLTTLNLPDALKGFLFLSELDAY